MKIALAFAGLLAFLALAVGLFLAWGHTSSTSCFGSFDSRQAAVRAALIMEAAGHDAEVEPSGPRERHPESQGGRQTAVTFSDGETGEDARAFREAFEDAVERENGVGGQGGCTERTPFD
jgi:hypothetical protein